MAWVVMDRQEQSENLQAIVSILNDVTEQLDDWKEKRYGRDETVRLRRMVRAWQEMREVCCDSGPDLRKIKLAPEDRVSLGRFTTGLRVSTQRDGSLEVLNYGSHGWDEAALQFTRWIRNTQQHLLGGPCPGVKMGKRCERWFLRKNRRGIFCSRQCAGNAAQAAKRKKSHGRNIDRARVIIARYPNRPKRFASLDWKEYVKQAVPKISKRFLTMAVREGELMEPKV